MSESVVGGNLVEVPIARLGFTGSDDKSDSVCDPCGPVLGKTYYQIVSIRTSLVWSGRVRYNMWAPLERRDTSELNALVVVKGLSANCPCSKHYQKLQGILELCTRLFSSMTELQHLVIAQRAV